MHPAVAPFRRVPGGRTRRVVAVAAAVAVVAVSCRGPSPAPAAAAGLPAGADAVVDRVVDGDTLLLEGGERVRLIGVDTPETHDPRRPVECFGPEASAFTEALLPPGTWVRLVGDVEPRDAYDRLLAYVYRRSDGVFVNAELVRAGMAETLERPPNRAKAPELGALAREAQEAGRGLWSVCGDPARAP